MRRTTIIQSAIAAMGLMGCSAAQTMAQTAYTAGDFFGNSDIVLARRVASGGSTVGAVALDNYRITSGAGSSAILSYIQTLSLASTGSTAHTNNVDNSELRLNQYTAGGTTGLTLVGYNTPAGGSTGTVITGTSTTVNRVVTSVTSAGTVTSNTLLNPVSFFTTASSGKIPVTSAVTQDGVNYFVSADNNRGGVTRITAGTTDAGTIQTNNFPGSGTSINTNALKFNGNKLYAVGGVAGTDNTVYEIAYSNTTTGTATALPGLSGIGSVRFIDLFFAGANTIYLSDDGGMNGGSIGGLHRYDFDGTNWLFKYKINSLSVGDGAGLLSGYRDLSGTYDASTGRVDIYATNATNNIGHLMGITDFLGNTLGSQATSADLTGSNTFSGVWKGVEVFIPAPSMAGLLGLAVLHAGRRRR